MPLEVDYEEGSISDNDFRGMEGDEDIYLDRFPDPFLQPILPTSIRPGF